MIYMCGFDDVCICPEFLLFGSSLTNVGPWIRNRCGVVSRRPTVELTRVVS